jgi:lipopolysaccharide transport system permease protein
MSDLPTTSTDGGGGPAGDPGDLARRGWTVHRAGGPLELSYVRRLLAWRELELLLFFAWRDLKVRNKQMLLGTAWTVLQPLVQVVLFSVLLGRFAGLPSEGGLPYPVLVLAGLLPWQYVSTSLTRCAASLSASQALLTKVAFPRVVLPAAAILPGLVDLLVAMGLLVPLMLWYRIPPAPSAVFLPAFLLLAMLTALAVGLWLSALSARYRDVRYVLPFLLQVWMLATPVGYSVEIIPTGLARGLYELNPLAVIVRGVRWSLFGTAPPTPAHLVSVLLVALVLVTGLAYFRRVERTLADVV